MNHHPDEVNYEIPKNEKRWRLFNWIAGLFVALLALWAVTQLTVNHKHNTAGSRSNLETIPIEDGKSSNGLPEQAAPLNLPTH